MSKKRSRLTGVVGFAAVAASAGALFLGAGAAHAATPPFEPDPNAVGTLSFYDASGNQITSGRSDTAPFAAYVAGSAPIRSGDSSAALFYAAPDPNKTTTGYFKAAVGIYTPYPTTTAPASVNTISQTRPVNTGDSSDLSLDDFRSQLSSPSTAAGYDQVVQIRMRTSNSAGQSGLPYDDASVLIDPVAHTWTQIYPKPVTNTSTTVTANPSPATVGDTVTLTATETPAAAGSVQFQDGTTNIGSPVAVDGTGKATTTTSTLAQGNHTINAVFTPTDTTSYNGSTGSTTITINPAATPTSTSLAVTQDGTAGDAASLAATVTGPGATPNSSGKVDFYDNGSTTSLGTVPGSAAVNGVYTLNLPSGFAAGPHSVVAKFTPTDVTQFRASQSGPQSFTTAPVQKGACAAIPATSTSPGNATPCIDTQNIQATVDAGTLLINTPYTASAPLDLGTLAPNTAGTELTASKPFQNIKVTDLRNGVSGYTVVAQSSNLTDGKGNPGSTINSQNVGLTGVTTTADPGVTGTIATMPNPAADPAVGPTDAGTLGLGNAQHTVFKVTGASRGTVTANGTLTLNAPTSTEPGLFTGTITFTVG